MKKLMMMVAVALAAATAAWGESAAFARATGAKMRLDTRAGTRLAAMGASETITYSPRWDNATSCTVTADGATLKTASAEGEVSWSPDSTGAHTLTHTAGGETQTAQFTVLGDDVAQHAGSLAASETWGSNQVHLVTGDVTVPSGKTLTIERGAVVKFMTGTALTVNGTCTAYGVIFTHVNDDTAGGDTLMDGDAAKPVMDGYKLTGNIYEDDATEERYTAPQTLTSSISGTLRLKGHKVYLANSSITVNSGATLTLLPGAIIKFASGCSMTVNGTLDAQGTRAAPIVFTSQKDDDWGGDTNGDGEKTYAQAGDWHQITGSGTVKMNYCQVLWCSSVNNQGALYPNGGSWTFDNSIVAHCEFDCMRSYGGTFNANNSVFMDSSMGAAPSSGTCRFVNCVFYYLTTAVRWGCGSYYNCIFAEIAEDIIDTKFYSSTVNSPFGHCCFWAPNATGDKAGAKVGKDGNIWADPKFVDPDNGDFRIAADSPCIDAGDGTVAPELDYYGRPRMDAKGKKATGVPNADGICPDIGIYEFSGTPIIPVADLAVLSVTAPSAAVPGEELAITYVVTNRGAADATGMVRDQIALKGADAVLGGQTIAAGEVEQLYSLAAGAAATFTARVKCPAAKSGAWLVGVTANAERDVFEQVTANNAGWASEATQVSLPSLAAGGTQNVVIPANGSVGVAVSGMPQTGSAAVMTLPVGVTVVGAVGYVPEQGRFDVAGVALADGRTAVLLPTVPQGETVYLTFENATGAEVSFDVTAQTTQEGLELAKPADVPVTKKGPNVETKLVLPSSVRDGRIYTAWVEYANTGDEEAELPIFTVSRRSGGATLAATQKGPFEANSLNLIGLAPSAPCGKLKPGEAGKVAFYFLTQGTVGLALSVVTEKSTSTLNGFATVAEYRAGMSAAATRLCARGGAEPDFTAVLAQALNEKRGAGGAAVCGTLRHAVTKLPLEGYVMTLVDTNDMSVVAAAKTDANGAFVLATTIKGGYAVTVDGVQAAEEPVVAIGDADLTGVMVSALPFVKITGVAYADGLPSVGAKIVLDDERTEECEDAYVVTDDGGCFAFDGLFDGVYRLAGGPANGKCATQTDWLVASNGVSVNVEILYTEPGRTVEGSVRFSAGANDDDVRIVLTGVKSGLRFSSGLDDDGRFTLDGLPEGSYQVELESENCEVVEPKRIVVGGAAKVQCDVVAGDRAVFAAVNPIGMSPHASRFVLMKEVSSPQWDFDGDGVTDSTAENPMWTFSSVGNHDVRLTYVDGEGKARSCIVSRAVRVIEKFDNILKPNGHLVGTGTSVGVVSVADGEVVLSGAEVAGYAVGDVIGSANGGGGFVRRVMAKPVAIDGGGYSIRVETAELYDLYEQYFVAGDFTMTASQVKNALNNNAKRLSAIPPSAKKEWDIPLSITWEIDKKNALTTSGSLTRYTDVVDGSYVMLCYGGETNTVVNQYEYYQGQIGIEYSHTYESNEFSLWKSKKKTFKKNIEGPGIVLPYGFYLSMMATAAADLSFSGNGKIGVSRDVSVWRLTRVFNFNGETEVDVLDWSKKPEWDPPKLTVAGSVSGEIDFNVTVGVYISWPACLKKLGHAGGGVKAGVKVGASQDLSETIEFGKQWDVSFDSKLSLSVEPYLTLCYSAGFGTPNSAYSAAGNLPWKVSMPGSVSVSKLDFTTGGKGLTVDFTAKNPELEATGLLQFLHGIDLGAKAHSWNFGDGQGGAGETPSHTFPKEGEYTIKLKTDCNLPSTLIPLGEETLFGKVATKNIRVFDDKPPEPQTDAGSGSISPAKSCDPNEMAGPLGSGDPETERFVKPGEWMDYTIYFENKADADVPAQEVFVDAQLSEWLDWSTFEMGEVAFNNQNEAVLAGLKNGLKTVAQNGASYKVQLSVAFDETTGAAHWYLRSYDPSRSEYNYWPAAVDAGFLPPNDETHRGEGHITYRVKVREDAPTGVQIDAAATIVFDQNEPIPTDPAWWNTVSSTTIETSGQYVKLDLVENLGVEIPSDVDYAAGDKVTIKVEGLAKGLKVVATPVYEDPDAKKKVIANYVYTIEGVPTEPVDFEKQPMFARVTVTYKDKTKTADKSGKVETLQPVVLTIETPEPTVLTAGALNAVYGPVDIAALWPAVADAKTNPKDWSFKGWPTGLKYNATAKDASWSYKGSDGKTVKTSAAPYTVYGQPTKAGEFPLTATYKRKLADGKTTVNETYSAVLTVWGDDGVSDFRSVSQAYVALTKNFGTGVTAMSGLPAGLKFTAKAVAATAKAPAQEAGDVYGTPTKPGVFAVTATKADKTKETFLWKVTDGENPGLDAADVAWSDAKLKYVAEATHTVRMLQGLSLDIPVDASALASGAKVTVSGLPSGLKYDAKTGRITGVATKAESKVVMVKVVQNGITEVRTFAIVVDANPFAGAYCTYLIKPKSEVESYAATAVVTPAVGGSAKVVLDEYVPSLGKTVKTTVNVKGFTMLSEYDPSKSGEIEIMYTFTLAANAKGNPDYATEEREFLVALWRWTDEGVGFSEGECALRSSGFGVNGGVIKALTAAEYVTYAEKFAKAAPEAVTAVVQDDAGHFLYGSAVFDEKKVQYQLTGKLRDGTAVKALLPLGTLDGGFVSAPCLLVEKGRTKRAAVGALLETEDSGDGTAMKMWLWGTAAGQMMEPCSRFDKSGIPATAAAALGGDSELVLDAAELAASGYEGEAPVFRLVVNGADLAKAKLDVYAPGAEEGAKPLASLASAKLQASTGYVFKGSFKWDAKVGGDGNTYSFELVPSTAAGKLFVGRCEVKPAKGASATVGASIVPDLE